ncbi:MAG: SPOCS domain-containing protein [Desulfotomaculales bacterium]
MSIKTERLKVKQVVGERTKQVAVRQRITIPETKPPAEQVVNGRAQAEVTQSEVIKNKVLLEGRITVHVTYVAAVPAQSVHHVEQEIQFTEAVEIPGAEPGMDVFTQVTVEQVKAHVDEANPRVIVVTVILKLFVKVTKTVEVDVVVDAPAANFPKKKKVRVEEVIAAGEAQVVISEQLTIPAAKPDIAEVLDVLADVTITNKEVLTDKVVVEGVLTLQVIYVAALPGQPVHHAHVQAPFVEFIEVPGAEPDMHVDVQVRIEDVSGRRKSARELAVDAVLSVKAEGTATRELTVVVHIQGHPELKKIRLFLAQVVGEAVQQVVLRETGRIPDQKPPAQKVLDVFVHSVEVTETEILANKVIVRGAVEVKVTYVSTAVDQPVHAFEERITFNVAVPIPGAKPDMTVQVTVTVEHASGDLVNEREVAKSIVLRVGVRVTRVVQEDVLVKRIVEEPPPECKPGEVIEYTIRPGDTLFHLARRFGTTVHAILELNPGLDPMNLQVGMAIKIPCNGDPP